MIGVDTNVLVRFFTQDDPVQSEQADALVKDLSAANPAWIGTALLLELVWVLTKIYRIDRQSMIRILERLIDGPEFRIESADAVYAAVGFYRRYKAGFADCLIAASARSVGCGKTVTFDKVAARDLGMELLR